MAKPKRKAVASLLPEYVRQLVLLDPSLDPLEITDEYRRVFFKKWGRHLFDIPTTFDAPWLDAPVTFRFNGGCGSRGLADAMKGWRQALGQHSNQVRFGVAPRACASEEDFHCSSCHPASPTTSGSPCHPEASCRRPHHHTVCHGAADKIRTLRVEVDLARLPRDRKLVGETIMKLIKFAEQQSAPEDPYIAKLRRTEPATFERALERYKRWLRPERPAYRRQIKDQVRRDVALIYESIHRKPYRERQPTQGDLPAYECPTHGQDCIGKEECTHLKNYERRYLSFLPSPNAGRGMSGRVRVAADPAGFSATEVLN